MKISKLNFILIILLLASSFLPQINAAATSPLDEEISWTELIEDLDELRNAFIDDYEHFNIFFSPTWTKISWDDIKINFPKIDTWLPDVYNKISKGPRYVAYFDALIPVFTNIRNSCYQIISDVYRKQLNTTQQGYAQGAPNLVDNNFMGKWGNIQFELTFINLTFSIIYDLITKQIFTDLILNKKSYSESYLQDTKIKPSKTFQEINKLTPEQLQQFCKIFGVIYKFLVEILIGQYNQETPISKTVDEFFKDPDNNEKWKAFIQEHIKLFVCAKDATGTLQAGNMVMYHFKTIYSNRINELLNLAYQEIKDQNKIKGRLELGKNETMEAIAETLSFQMLSNYLTAKWMNTPFTNQEINYQNKEQYFSQNFSTKLKDEFFKKIDAYKKIQYGTCDSEKIAAIKFFYDLEFQKMLFRIHHPKIGCLPSVLLGRMKPAGGVQPPKTTSTTPLQQNLAMLRKSLTQLKTKMELLQQRLELLNSKLKIITH